MVFADVIVLALVGVVVGLAFAGSRRDARRGCSGCCANCMQAGGCAMRGERR